nr:TetR/AcrR family transcriptional regulator [Arthrobacter sp. SDTb3-6]
MDGALRVMRSKGLARTTTKEIARASGCSEPLLYRHFEDKIGLFLAVLAERLPPVGVLGRGGADLIGRGTLEGNLRLVVAEVTGFYLTVLPIGMSIFSDSLLLARHRDAVQAHGTGPEIISSAVRGYLAGEQAAGRIRRGAPLEGAAMALTGAAMHRAFLWRFHAGDGEAAPSTASLDGFAAEVVAGVVPSLSVAPAD